MNDQGKKPVIELKDHIKAKAVDELTPISNLNQKLHDSAIDHIKKSLTRLFETTDDALFEMAEKSDSNAAQTDYFSSMREIRKQRLHIERRFKKEFTKNFSELKTGKPVKALEPDAEELQHENLSLVDESQLEETLAVSNMVSKAENKLSQSLFALNERLTVINGGDTIDMTNNPVGPALLCNAFFEASKELDVVIDLKLVFFKLFEKHVMNELAELYDDLNDQLATAGVLPQLRRRFYTPPRTERPASQEKQEAPAEQPSTEKTSTAKTTVTPGKYKKTTLSEDEAKTYELLKNLLGNRRQHDYDTALADLPSFEQGSLISALELLQKNLEHSQKLSNSLELSAQKPLAKTDLVANLSQVNAQDGRKKIAPQDEDVIDLVGMLFEFIVQDRNLPDAIQALLSRLQIPYLKAAILDRHIFASRNHPARQLLDELARSGLAWSPDSDRDQKIFSKMREIVHTLLSDFNNDLGIFEMLRDDFRSFLAQSDKRASMIEKRAADAARGQEKLLHARRRSAEIIKTILNRQEKELPILVYSLLTRAWANVLVLIHLRQGEDSKAWSNSVRIARDLAWAAEAKSKPEHQEKVGKLVPIFNKALKTGLGLIGYHENDIRRTVGHLNGFFAEKTEAGSDMDNATAITTPPGADRSNFVESILKESEKESEAAVKWSGTESLSRVETLEQGAWCEFKQEDGKKVRGKLSWISPISGKLLFVNHKGLKITDMTRYQLVEAVEKGTAVILNDDSLVDRAMGAIAEQLKEQESDSGKHDPARGYD